MIVHTIKDERGKIELEVDLIIDRWRNPTGRYDVIVLHTPPRKRTATVNPEIATPQEIYEAKMKFWEMIKPKQ